MKLADRILGGFIGVVGMLCFGEAYRVWNGWNGIGIMPIIIGVISTFLLAMLVVFPSRDSTPKQWFSKKEILRILFISIFFALYNYCMRWVGYPIATWLFLAVISKNISPTRMHIILIWTGIVAVGSYIIFAKYGA